MTASIRFPFADLEAYLASLPTYRDGESSDADSPNTDTSEESDEDDDEDGVSDEDDPP